MREGDQQSRGGGLRRALLVAGGAALGAPLGWLGYSALFVDHDVPLGPALQAPRHEIHGQTGRISCYFGEATGGRPLLLIHSINAGASAYECGPLFERHRWRRPVVAPDLPGFGHSDRSDRSYTPELYAAAIVDVLQATAPRGADVVALSLSGEFAARAAVQRPDLFHTLTLISPTGFGGPSNARDAAPAAHWETARRSYRLLANPLWAQALYDLLVTRPSIRFFLSQSFAGPVDRGLLEYDVATTHRPGARYAPLHFVAGLLFTPGVRESIYARVPCPSLVVHDQVPFAGFEHLAPFVTRHPLWRSADLGATRGLPHFERPAVLDTHLLRLWADVESLAVR